MTLKRSHTITEPGHARLWLEFPDVPHLAHLGRVRFGGAHRPLEPHVHEHAFEICYLARGRQTYHVDNTFYALRGHDVYITFPDEVHDSGGFPEEKSLLYYLVLQAPSAREGFLGLPRAEGRMLYEALLRIPTRHFHASPALGVPLERMICNHARVDDPLNAMRIRQSVVAFLLELLDASAASGSGSTPHEAVARVQAYVAEHLTGVIRLEELAAVAHMSLSRFKTIFRQTTGIPPREYVLREKILAAQKVLVHSKTPVTEIALDFGFSSSQYFATVFLRYTGMSPQAFRANDRSGKFRSRLDTA